jgi:outer membrane immunogenic protein
MRTLRTLVVASALVVPFAGSALAADLVQSQPAPTPPAVTTPVNTWAGPYAGIYLGYGWDHFNTNTPVGDVNASGVTGGVYGGYNWQSGSWVYGLEGDLGYADANRTTGGLNVKQGMDGSIRGRIGWAADPFLTYITGGYAATDSRLAAGNSDSHVLSGWTIGAGVETKLTRNLTARVEYRYSDYGSQTYNLGGTGYSSGLSTNELRVGLGFQF